MCVTSLFVNKNHVIVLNMAEYLGQNGSVIAKKEKELKTALHNAVLKELEKNGEAKYFSYHPDAVIPGGKPLTWARYNEVKNNMTGHVYFYNDSDSD